jgi:hypothetical protein
MDAMEVKHLLLDVNGESDQNEELDELAESEGEDRS